MRPFPNKKRTRRRRWLVALTVFAVLGGAATAGWLMLPDLVERRARHAMSRVGELLGVEITAAEVHLQGTDTLILEQVRIRPLDAGAEEPPLLLTGQVAVRFAPLSALDGKPRIEQVTVAAPEVTVIRRAGGGTNLDGVRLRVQKLAEKRGARGGGTGGLWSVIERHVPDIVVDGGALAWHDERPERPQWMPATLTFSELAVQIRDRSVMTDRVELELDTTARAEQLGATLRANVQWAQGDARLKSSVVLTGPLTVPLGTGITASLGRVSWHGGDLVVLNDIAIDKRVDAREVTVRFDANPSGDVGTALSPIRLLEIVSVQIVSVQIVEPIIHLPGARDLVTLLERAQPPTPTLPAAESNANPPLGKRPRLRKKGAKVREKLVGLWEKGTGKIRRGARAMVGLAKRLPLPEITIERGRLQTDGAENSSALGAFGIHLKREGETIAVRLTVSDNPDERIEGRIAVDTGRLDLTIAGGLPLGPLSSLLPKSVALNPGARLSGTDLTFTYLPDPESITVKGAWGVDGVRLELPWLAPAPMAINGLRGSVNVVADVAEASLTVEDAHVSVGPARLNYTFGVRDFTQSPVLTWTFDLPRTDAQAVVDALPTPMLGVLRGMKLKGAFAWKNTGRLDTRDMRSLDYDSKLESWAFGVDTLGKRVDFNVLRKPFVHRVREGSGKKVEFTTGPRSRRWVPYSRVSPWMGKVLTTTEDGTFWRHHGLAFFALKDALVANLERGRFYRGASTLTQQLVKNVFLSRDKTIARKLQEMFLAWRLESFFKKKDILALYLNIVELGPDLYGIGKASWHYFGKPPSDLDVVECAFLASLLPNPRRYYYQYTRGSVTEGWRKGLQKTLEVMHKRGKLTEDELQLAAPYSPEFRR